MKKKLKKIIPNSLFSVQLTFVYFMFLLFLTVSYLSSPDWVERRVINVFKEVRKGEI